MPGMVNISNWISHRSTERVGLLDILFKSYNNYVICFDYFGYHQYGTWHHKTGRQWQFLVCQWQNIAIAVYEQKLAGVIRQPNTFYAYTD